MKKVLYIGEKNLIAKAMQSMVTSMGFHFLQIDDPTVAFGSLFSEKFALILTNLMHEKMDGVQLYNSLTRSNTINSFTPVVIMTSGENIEKLFPDHNRPKYIFKKNEELVLKVKKILEEESENEVTQKVRVLYIEDDKFIQKLVKMWIGKVDNIELDMADSVEGLELFSNKSYDVIVSDNLLSDGNAKDVIKFIQNHTALKDTPILIYTGTVENLKIAELQKYGKVLDILPKPFEMNTFLNKLDQIKKLKN
jgi:DNA-binding NtrC family response regulator